MPSAHNTVALQRQFFASGGTRETAFRKHQLGILKNLLAKNEAAILATLKQDLGKPAFEAYGGEVLVVLREAKHALRNLSEWMRPQRAHTSLLHFPGSSRFVPEPLGISAIISPWNFPFQLAMVPLVAAIASGNCAILKPSEFSPATSALLADLIGSAYPEEYVCVRNGGAEIAEGLIDAGVDHVFFTGSTRVGKRVAEECAKRLIPFSLELGGKNPCLILPDADMDIAAKRIAWGKTFNCGQSCVAPDYVLVPKGRKEELIDRLKAFFLRSLGPHPESSPSYGRIVNQVHFRRLLSYLEGTRIRYGGGFDAQERFLAPTLVEPGASGHPILAEEIFGPILLVREYEGLPQALETIASLPSPLAAYVFSRDPARARAWCGFIRCGALVFNDTVSHFLSTTLPFGGIGASGNAKYHGKFGFMAFSHLKAEFRKSTRLDIPLRYPPYDDGKLGILRSLRFFG